MYIRNLVITCFFKLFEQLVQAGHVYVLETPLFRVRNKEKPIYCHREAERDATSTKLGGKPEITRFNGLGEISPKEFAQFTGKQMRLSKVEYAPRAESGPIFNFYRVFQERLKNPLTGKPDAGNQHVRFGGRRSAHPALPPLSTPRGPSLNGTTANQA